MLSSQHSSGGLLIVAIRLLAQQKRFNSYEHRSSATLLLEEIPSC